MAEDQHQDEVLQEVKEEVGELAPFDPTKKKKKKKVVIQDPAEGENMEKVTEKVESLSLVDGMDSAFAGKKKKKKKMVESDIQEEENWDSVAESNGLENADEDEGEGIVLRSQFPWEGTTRDYQYDEVRAVRLCEAAAQMATRTTKPAGLAMVIMGVSGSGKSTIGDLLAKSLGCPFLDADDFHSAENKEKMRKGIPLTDSDRIPWLETLRDALIDYILRGKGVVLACSALQPSYRNILRMADYESMLEMQLGAGSPPSSHRVKFFLLNGSMDLFASRLERRVKEGAHFMPPSLLQSQMDSLKITENEGVIFLDASVSPEVIVDHIKEVVCHGT